MLPGFKKILLATDFSKSSWMALKYAAGLSRNLNAQIYLLHVLPDLPKEWSYSVDLSIMYGYGPGMAGVSPTLLKSKHSNKEETDKKLQQAREKAEKTARDHITSLWLRLKSEERQLPNLAKNRIIVRVGDPSEKILDEVNHGNYDLLLMGRRGHSKLRGNRIGGVAMIVMERSQIPALLIDARFKK